MACGDLFDLRRPRNWANCACDNHRCEPALELRAHRRSSWPVGVTVRRFRRARGRNRISHSWQVAVALAEALVGDTSSSRLLDDREPGDLQPGAWTQACRTVGTCSRPCRRHRLVRGAIDRRTGGLWPDFSADSAGDADHNAADLDCRLGGARSHHGTGVRICRDDDKRGCECFAAFWRSVLYRRRGRRVGLDFQRREGSTGFGADFGSGVTASLVSMTVPELALSLFAVVAAAMLSAGMTWAIHPLLLRHALARPNARSSHRVPTPQGAGIAVTAATLVVSGAVIGCAGTIDLKVPVVIFAASLFIAAVGFADDLKSIPILPRLLLQAVAVGAIIFAAPSDLRIAPACPLWIERVMLLFAGLWFVNLVNFMDGLDWMTLAETVPISGAIVILGSFGELPTPPTIVAAALCGAMVGFAPFNRPVAKLFLGDVGSLPIGLLLGWCLLQLAWHQQIVAALLLPLYYLSDATVTLLRRMARREPFWTAHRSHFYQRATDNGFTVLRVVGEVFALNVGLAALAIASTVISSPTIRAALLLIGSLAVALAILRFSRPR